MFRHNDTYLQSEQGNTFYLPHSFAPCTFLTSWAKSLPYISLNNSQRHIRQRRASNGSFVSETSETNIQQVLPDSRNQFQFRKCSSFNETDPKPVSISTNRSRPKFFFVDFASIRSQGVSVKGEALLTTGVSWWTKKEQSVVYLGWRQSSDFC